ncbi:S-phase kinase-associated protein 1 [Taenia crassiceps]|uniref:S-phase kinase-associated protein 1 n=1 Tax=Taenia crassiceps TaxID=6207 RepID=A0ABR4Q4F2_9CEST
MVNAIFTAMLPPSLGWHHKMYIKVVTSDGVVFEVDLKVIRQSEVVRQSLDRCENGAVGTKEPILLERVNSSTFRKVLHWCTYHRDDDDEESKSYRMYDAASWEREFFRTDKPSVSDLLTAATYLAFTDFRDACSRILSTPPRRRPRLRVCDVFATSSEGEQSTSND